jgi:hypothetical protein
MSTLRHLETKDYYPIIQVANEWWGDARWQVSC